MLRRLIIMLKQTDIVRGALVRTIYGGPVMCIVGPAEPIDFCEDIEEVSCSYWASDYLTSVKFPVWALRLLAADEQPFDPYLNPVSVDPADMLSKALDRLSIVLDSVERVISINYSQDSTPPTKRSSEFRDEPAKPISEEELNAIPGMIEMGEDIHPCEWRASPHPCANRQPAGCLSLIDPCDIGGVIRPCPQYPKSIPEKKCPPRYLDPSEGPFESEATEPGLCVPR